jgi:predicted transposase YdaD
MRESVIYQDIKEEDRQDEARSLILKLLTRRVGTIPPEAQAQIEVLSLEQLEALGEALLDFAGADDLRAWLQGHQ